ncbi:GNAT family N-acetyltransferase [Alkalihalobacillus sp. LMS6]|uniref:GNAT family N-acetyltransferase n=1 Tax=Bacillaceae TaxID=186817 RepID=UPI000C07D8C8|nr:MULTISPECIES: GNAT family N-acetyltransferase [Bacillaceae]UTR07367.1 GNAT family N-acetyltransferase [Alkalihalobacillus sp. LMS6]
MKKSAELIQETNTNSQKPQIKLVSLSMAHEAALHQFELENRSYFESMVPSRGDAFYNKNEFRQRLTNLIKEEEDGQGIFYLLFNEVDDLVGRFNLVIDGNQADIGYRIGEAFSGRGYATQALQLVIEEVRAANRINELTAKTTSAHRASQQILLKNGFTEINGHSESFMWNGQEQWFIYYQKKLS